jgi:Xaa-Pro aminopeptidase
MDDAFREELDRRRAKIAEFLATDTDLHGKGGKGTALLLFSAPVQRRNGDVEYPYRQHSDFYYLTGFEEPESAVLLFPDEPKFVLFVRKRDREREIWDGYRAGVDGAKEIYGAKEAYVWDDFSKHLPDLLEDRTRIFYLMGEESAWDRTVIDALGSIRRRRQSRAQAPTELVDARKLVHELRLRKSTYERERLAEVSGIAANGHRAAMAASRPGMYEWELQNAVETSFRSEGARSVAYESIVGSGPSATILHYRENSRRMQDGDLVLIDAGAEKYCLASDITRTFPVSGAFSPLQRSIYETVLAAQVASIEATVVGATLDSIHEAAFQVLTEGLRDWGLLAGIEPGSDAMKERVKRFYMHRTSHFLGMDVHDVGSYYVQGEPRRLESDMVITVEPGLYFAPDDETIPSEFRGIGIRIEDDVVITESGPLVLTLDAPKTISEVEAACNGN